VGKAYTQEKVIHIYKGFWSGEQTMNLKCRRILSCKTWIGILLYKCLMLPQEWHSLLLKAWS